MVETLEPRSLLSAGFAAKVDFQPDGAPAAPGYVADAGHAYGPRADGLTFGWDKDVTKRARAAASSAAPGDHYEDFIAPGRVSWGIGVPNGTYLVRVAAGDGKTGRRAKVDVEGVRAIDAKTSKAERWVEGTALVTVADGVLTVAPGDNYKNNRLAFVEVEAIDVGPDPDYAPAAPTGTGVPADETGSTTSPQIRWAPGTSAPRSTRVEGGVAHVGTKLYVMGGYVDGFRVDNTTDVFDAATNTWSRGPDFPGAQTHAGVASDGTRYIYKVSGQLSDGVPGTPTPDAWVLDTATNRWSPLPPIPEARYAPGLAYVDGKLHLFGGTRPDRTTVVADHLVLDVANPSAGWQPAAPLPEPGDHLSVAVIDGQMYAVGGEHGHAARLPEGDAAYIQHDHLLRYDPKADAWAELADVPRGRSHAEGTTLVVNGKILMMGGKLNATDVSGQVDLYDPATNAWTTLNGLPRLNQGGAAIFHDGKIYLSHGQTGAPSHAMYRYTWVGTVRGI